MKVNTCGKVVKISKRMMSPFRDHLTEEVKATEKLGYPGGPQGVCGVVHVVLYWVVLIKYFVLIPSHISVFPKFFLCLFSINATN